MPDLIQPGRRGFLLGLASLVAAPAVIRVAKLMPIKPLPVETPIPVIWGYQPMWKTTYRLERDLDFSMLPTQQVGKLIDGCFVRDQVIVGDNKPYEKLTLESLHVGNDTPGVLERKIVESFREEQQPECIDLNGEKYRLTMVEKEMVDPFGGPKTTFTGYLYER